MTKTLRIFLVLALFALTACGGAVDETYTGVLEAGDDVQQTDNSLQDPYQFRTKQGYMIRIEMTSDELNPYLILSGPDGNKIGENDDAEAGSTTARLELVAPADGTYHVLANTAPGNTGNYTLHIQATEPQ